MGVAYRPRALAVTEDDVPVSIRERLAANYYTQWFLCHVGVHDWGTYRTANGDDWTRCVLCAKRPVYAVKEQS